MDLLNNINLTHLTFGRNFNQKIFIPLNIKSLNMWCCNNQYLIDNLHNNIEELNNLPNSIEYLELKNYEFKIKKIPKNLKTIKCDKEYEYIDDFKDYEVITC